MGEKHSKSVENPKKEKEIEPQAIKDFDRIIGNIKKRNLNEASDFSIKKLKQRAISLFEESKKLDNYKEKINKLEEAISYDNTNQIILKEYLFYLLRNNDNKFDDAIEKCYYKISPMIYNELLLKNKFLSSKDFLVIMFDMFKNYESNFEKDENKILSDINLKFELTIFFRKNKNNLNKPYSNSNFTNKSNLELALYEICLSLYLEMEKKINSLKKICENPKMSLDKKILKMSMNSKYTKNLMENTKANETITLLFYSRFYTEVLPNIQYYVCNLEKTIKKCLEFKDIKNDFYLLLFIVLEIKYMICFEDDSENTLKHIDKLNRAKMNIDVDTHSQEYSIIDNNAIINKNNIIIKDYHKYYLDEIIKYIKKHKSIDLDELDLIQFVKLEYFNTDNYVTSSKEFIEEFNNKVSNSVTVITALYELYPHLKEKKLFESDFIRALFKDVLETCYFYPFYGKKGATTLHDSGTVLFFIPNRTDIKSGFTAMERRAIYLLINVGIFVFLEFHEILGHFLRVTLSKLIDYKFISPRASISKDNEIEECIEYLLFGKKCERFTLKEVIYILDIENYNKHYEEFRRDFQNLESIKYEPSNDLLNMLNKIGVELSIVNIEDNKIFANIFSEYDKHMNSSVEVPFLFDCYDKFEFDYDENIINFLNNEMNSLYEKFKK